MEVEPTGGRRAFPCVKVWIRINIPGTTGRAQASLASLAPSPLVSGAKIRSSDSPKIRVGNGRKSVPGSVVVVGS